MNMSARRGRAAALLAAALVAGCSDMEENYPEFTELKRATPLVTLSYFNFDSESPSRFGPGLVFSEQSGRAIGASSLPVIGYLANVDNAQEGTLLTAEDGMAQYFANNSASLANFHIIVVPKDDFHENENVFVRLFGERVRSHSMSEPRDTCRVVSGVSNNELRVGVIHYVTVEEITGSLLQKKTTYDYENGSHCNMVALLMLFGFSEEEAKDYMPFVLEERGMQGQVIPDFDAITTRAGELSANGKGWPDWSQPIPREGEGD